MTAPIKNQPHLNPYDYHKYLINEYVLKKPGDTKLLRERDRRNWKGDKDVILENMKFIWNEDEVPATWEERLAKRYYDKLFREYCICDLSRYKENKIANRFRIEKEIVSGKGQFKCGETSCNEESGLRTWEVNFAYLEAGERKNALVKIRLCPSCSEKLNHHSKKREVKRLNRKKDKSKTSGKECETKLPTTAQSEPSTSSLNNETEVKESSDSDDEAFDSRVRETVDDERMWKKGTEVDLLKGRDEEFDDYLADLLL